MSNAVLTAAQKSPVKDGIVNWTKNVRALAALAEFKALKVIEAAGKKAETRRKEEVEPILREELNGATQVIVRGVVALKVQPSSNGKVDAEALKVAWPEAYAATYKSTPYTFLKAL
jgi:hypothetical protein